MTSREREPVGHGEGVELVEERHPHREIGVGEELDRLGVVRVGEEHGYVRLQRTVDQHVREGPRPLRLLPDDDARGVEVVGQRPALAQELGREDELIGSQSLAGGRDEPHGHRRLDHDEGVGVHGRDVADDHLHGRGVEGVALGVVVGRGRHDDDVGRGVRRTFGGEGDVEVTAREVGLELFVVDRARAPRQQVDTVGVDVDAGDVVLLPEQGGHGQPDVSEAHDDDVRHDDGS